MFLEKEQWNLIVLKPPVNLQIKKPPRHFGGSIRVLFPQRLIGLWILALQCLAQNDIPQCEIAPCRLPPRTDLPGSAPNLVWPST